MIPRIFEIQPLRSSQQMQDFVAHWDAELEASMDAVAQKIAAADTVHLIGLTGPTCSGKTTAAKKLTDSLEKHGHRVHIISVDDFYYDKEYLKKRADDDPTIEIDYDSEETINIDLLREMTQSLLAYQTTQLPRFDFVSGKSVKGEIISPVKGDVFLFEGIQILYPRVREILASDAYRSIYICPFSSIRFGESLFTPHELRLMRRLVRDHRYRNSQPEFTLYLWQSVRANEEKLILPYAQLCDFQIDSTMPYEVGMLKPYLEALLDSVNPEGDFGVQAREMQKKLASIQVVPSDYMTANSLYKEFI